MDSTKIVIFKVAVPVQLNQVFDYIVPTELNSTAADIGKRVLIDFHNQAKIGIVTAVSDNSDWNLKKLKPILKILDPQALFNELDLKFLHWLSEYYHYPVGEVICGALPAALKKNVLTLGEILPPEAAIMHVDSLKQAVLKLNPEQQQAFNICNSESKFQVFLLNGVTGSGKTEVYMQLMQTVLARKMQVMVLVPEINLTPQLEARFKARFATEIAIYHSKLSSKVRVQAWLKIQTGTAKILLGTRSAVFTPCKNLGLIILDEEHDNSFVQASKLRFSARDAAIMRAKLFQIPIILGSATPSLASLANVERQRYQLLTLTKRAGQAQVPQIILTDIRKQRLQAGLSASLLQAMRATLAKQEQVLLFLNRRGFAPVLICHDCAWVAECVHCDARLVVHETQKYLQCHHCGQQFAWIHTCLACHKSNVSTLGVGTQQLESKLKQLFPQYNVLRLDADNIKSARALKQAIAKINQAEVDIILGTQLLAKGHHFAGVTLVGLLDVDGGLFSADFHAEENLAQLITQVAGRAGRENKLGKVILQTRQPQHPVLLDLIRPNGYQIYAQQALLARKQAELPPFSYQALLRVRSLKILHINEFFSALEEFIIKSSTETMLILGPISAPMEKRGGYYHYQLLFQSLKRQGLHQVLAALIAVIETLKIAQKVQWQLDVDPISLL